MQDLVAGHIDLLVVQAAAALPQVRAGTVKAYANMSASRSPVVPGIPTADEGGVSGLYISGWFGFFAPKGTPKDIIAKLNAAMVQALAEPSVRARFSELGLDVAARELQTPEGARRVPQGRNREMVADHQGRRHQGGMKPFAKSDTDAAREDHQGRPASRRNETPPSGCSSCKTRVGESI